MVECLPKERANAQLGDGKRWGETRKGDGWFQKTLIE